MKRFKFKLDVVLTERKRFESVKLKEWGMAQRILKQMIDEKTAMEKRLMEVFEESTLASSQKEGSISILHSMEVFIHGAKLKITWKAQEIERAKKLTEKKRMEYVFARQKREVIEKLRERKHQEYKNEMRKKELKEQDELYIMNGNAMRRLAEEEDVA
jgi:flagellar export protein FliJ